jgi:hemoglobin-like flavoprotein
MDEYQAVRESYERSSQGGDFPTTFYRIFFTKSPEIPALFTHTDFTVQKRLLKAAVLILIKYTPDEAEGSRHALERIGQTHSRGQLNIRPDLYPLFVDSLCEAVKAHDPEFSADLEALWRHRVRDGIDLITSMY